MAGPGRRIPNRDETRGAITGKAVPDQQQTDDSDHRKQSTIRPFADFGDQSRAPVSHSHKDMRAQKNDQAEDFDRKTHSFGSTRLCSRLRLAAMERLVSASGPIGNL